MKKLVVTLSAIIGGLLTVIGDLVGSRDHHHLVPVMVLLLWCGLVYAVHDTFGAKQPYWTCVVSVSLLGGAASTVMLIALAAVSKDPRPGDPLAFAGLFACIVTAVATILANLGEPKTKQS